MAAPLIMIRVFRIDIMAGATRAKCFLTQVGYRFKSINQQYACHESLVIGLCRKKKIGLFQYNWFWKL